VLLPTVGSDYLSLVDEIAAELDQLPTEAPTFTHGDLKSDNVLASTEGIRLLDLDRCGPADPALDLAKFVADLRWWSDEDRARTLADAFRSGYGACDPARWDRAEPLTRLLQLKLAARRCAVHDLSWESDVRARVSAAAPVMAGGA
jgi:Ser/Thr protein kinase RdoA (MazF antagonist)